MGLRLKYYTATEGELLDEIVLPGTTNYNQRFVRLRQQNADTLLIASYLDDPQDPLDGVRGFRVYACATGNCTLRFAHLLDRNYGFFQSSEIYQLLDGATVLSASLITENNTQTESTILCYNPDGSERWTRRFIQSGTSNGERLNVFAQDHPDTLMVVGRQGGTNYQLWLDAANGTTLRELGSDSGLGFSHAEDHLIFIDEQIVASNGREITRGNLSDVSILQDNDQTIQIPNLTSGMYILRVEDATGKRFVQQFVVHP